MGIVSGGGGGGTTFNGGTITTPLDIDSTSTSLDPFEATGGNGVDGGVEMVLTIGGHLTVEGLGGNNPLLLLNDDTSSNQVSIGGSSGAVVTADGSQVLRQNADGTKKMALNSLGVLIGVNGVPADGALSANQCYLWYDPTNAAAKLMAKAKTADGTVVTAAVALA